MTHRFRRARAPALMAITLVGLMSRSQAEQAAAPLLADGPLMFKTADQSFRAVPIASGLANPWSIAFLPGPSTPLGASVMLVTERPGRLRIIRDGKLDPTPVRGVPDVFASRLDGLMDIALHPRFAENKLMYLSYSKPGPQLPPGSEALAARLSQPPQRGASGVRRRWRWRVVGGRAAHWPM